MLQAITNFSSGLSFHGKGVRFGFRHPKLLGLAVLPFLMTLVLYIFAFHLFTLYAEALLQMIWSVDPEGSSRYVGWLYWIYMHVVKYLLYAVVLVIMFYTFIVLSNILASPFYDHIATKYEQDYARKEGSDRKSGSESGKSILGIIKEELKKAAFMLCIPLILMFIPVIGGFLGFIVAALFVAWDYVDFSLSRDHPLLKERLRRLWRHKFSLIGFGFPLVIPFLGLFLLPFAILGATRLYYEKIVPLQSPNSAP